MPNRFENYTFEQANNAFTKLKKDLDKFSENREFVKGEDWQNGKGWV